MVPVRIRRLVVLLAAACAMSTLFAVVPGLYYGVRMADLFHVALSPVNFKDEPGLFVYVEPTSVQNGSVLVASGPVTGPPRAAVLLARGLDVGTTVDVAGVGRNSLVDVVDDKADVLLRVSMLAGFLRVNGLWTGFRLPYDSATSATIVLRIGMASEGFTVTAAMHGGDDDDRTGRHRRGTIGPSYGPYPVSREAAWHAVALAIQSPLGVPPFSTVTIAKAASTRRPVFEPSLGILDESPRRPPLDTSRPVHLFVGVLTRPLSAVARLAMRNSWMLDPRVQDGHVVVRFFVGQNLNAWERIVVAVENEHFGDLVIAPYDEGYYNLANKTRHILEIGSRHTSANYILKCDDDTYVRLDRVIAALPPGPQDDLFFGAIASGVSPIRDPESMWYLSREDYPLEKLPPFSNGPGYVIASNLARDVTDAFAQNVLSFYFYFIYYY